MQPGFSHIALIGKPDANGIGEILPMLYRHLVGRRMTVSVEQGCAGFVSGDAAVGSIEELSRCCDLAIVIGGDGTLLRAARELAAHDIPLIGVNLGRLGFLVDISPHEATDWIDAMLEGHYREDDRFLLRAAIVRDDTVVHEQTAVNEVVVHSWNATSMIEIVTTIDGRFLNSQRSDGLIVSTPTGSTAYALSGGGPILHPALNAIVLVPINPHTLTNRPVVVANDSVVEISFSPGKQFRAQVVCDNVSLPSVDVSDRIRICRDRRFRMLHPTHYDFFEILRAKLNWSSGYRN